MFYMPNVFRRMNKDKLSSKSLRYAARLRESRGICCTEIPGPNIIICNAGQAVGLTKEHMIEQMVAYGVDVSTLKKFVSVKGECFAFLVFNSTEAAEVFFKKVNGRRLSGDIGGEIVYQYVEESSVVDDEYICLYDIPKGLHLLKEFLTKEEEHQFYSHFDWMEAPKKDKKLKNRLVKHFGYEFRYGTNDVDLDNPLETKIPDVCNVLWERLREHGFDLGIPDQLTVNKYLPGQGIPSHVDKHSPFGDTILSLSLGSSVVMDWKHHTGKYVPVVVPSRCLLVMQGEARYDWQHGINTRKWDPVVDENRVMTINGEEKRVRVVTSDSVPRQTRISLTFRWTRRGPCECIYKTLCDATDKKEITEELAANLEELHVHKIAGERCSGLLKECKENMKSLKLSNCIRLDLLNPCLIDNCADVILCIAVIHHFSSLGRRQQAVSTICRLLAPGGVALITAWAKDQSDSHYLHKHREQNPMDEIRSIGASGLTLPVHENRTQFKHNDILVPWKMRYAGEKNSNDIESVFYRFYHVFEEDELDDLCKDVPGIKILNSFKEDGNWCVIITKESDKRKSDKSRKKTSK
ncbi:alkylated DNA repair protein alkB homolog 8 isoform X4 [Hyposmocoma kahamanoa]|uniref:alkylated DNA repair protein alkB homolog 8 isoform X4 n=1 Tax=Hyposmocoma kahamanoa TaxID=1477025 RepID=UPI000E6DA4B1|nr:alkylated DNA repair protein alkB homolog 8 isoform X4 [Hyposmocoma kahamanoa]